jgi:hypothetical protein
MLQLRVSWWFINKEIEGQNWDFYDLEDWWENCLLLSDFIFKTTQYPHNPKNTRNPGSD